MKPRDAAPVRCFEVHGQGARLDVYLVGALERVSRARVQAAIRAGLVLRNGVRCTASQAVQDGDLIEWTPPPPAPAGAAEPEDIAVDVLYEDDDLLAVNKAAGMVVHPGAGTRHGTLVSALLHRGCGLSTAGGPGRPGIVHRLDKETSGVLLVARHDHAHAALAAQFAGREVAKTYLALVERVPRRSSGSVEEPIGRHPVHRKKMAPTPRGRPAETAYRVLGQTPAGLWLIECKPITGRTHQIRVHLQSLGCPVAGDALYGRRGGHARHMLHAWKITFRHPRTGFGTTLEAPPPADFLLQGRAVARKLTR